MQRYNPKEIEPKWQVRWEADKIYQASDEQTKPKKYMLEYFPYPSGAAMHVGHVRNYTIGDALARYNRMSGYNVLHPMGWDGFGLPAENYAIKNKISPRKAIDENTARFREQLMQMGFSYDWSREIDSTDPQYYRWTQWLFLLLFRRGLAYQQESLQWWCPYDKTVLANEQVEAGVCWRCGNQVEKKSLKQWFFKITEYADRLDKDLDDVNWSESIKSMQRNWIGRSKGAEITFQIAGFSEDLTVFTTRADTLYGATFMVMAPEHPLVAMITSDEQRAAVDDYVKRSQAKSDVERQETDREKTGVFTGAYAINPANGQKIPIWIADYVLFGYGTGAIMAVPAHDERDYAFARKFDLPVIWVVNPEVIRDDAADKTDFKQHQKIVAIVENDAQEVLTINWGPQLGGRLAIGGTIEDDESPETTALREVAEETGYTDLEVVETGAEAFYYKYYAFSKQEAHDASVRFVHLRLKSDAQQPQKLDESEKNKFQVEWVSREVAQREITEPLHQYGIKKFINGECFHGEGLMTNSGPYDGMASSDVREKIVADLEIKAIAKERVNYKIRDWLISRQRYWGAPIPIIHCEKDGAVAVPEDQLPVLLPPIESYEPSGDGRSPLANVPEFVNTTCPKCGGPAQRETDTMDGFACSSWYFLRFADPHNNEKAFDSAKVAHWLPVDDYIGGAEHAVMHLLYARFWTKVMQDEGLITFGEPFKTLRNHGMILAPDGSKMSKSKGNTIEPGVLIDQGYGADAIRIMELFIGPWNQVANWSVEGMGGAHRFLARIWTLIQEYQARPQPAEAQDCDEALLRITHRTIKKVSEDFLNLSFNTAIASEMEAVNELYRLKAVDSYSSSQWKFALESLLQLLAPFAPHIAEELWAQLRGTDAASIHTSEWPGFDESWLVSQDVTIVVQVNGKLRAQLQMPRDVTEKQAVEAARQEPNVKAHLEGGTLAKTIYVPGKLVNFVVKA